MSYCFNAMTDEEIESFNLLPDGVYEFEVVKSTRRVSKKQNPMAELQLTVFDKEGKAHTVFDYLVFSMVNLNIKKIKDFCYAVGLEKEYEQGSMPEELERFAGKVSIGIQDEQPNDNGGFYPKKNCVVSYIRRNKDAPKNDSKSDFIDDDVPF